MDVAPQMRRAMVRPGRDQLAGRVEVTKPTWAATRKTCEACGQRPRQLLHVAIEVLEPREIWTGSAPSSRERLGRQLDPVRRAKSCADLSIGGAHGRLEREYTTNLAHIGYRHERSIWRPVTILLMFRDVAAVLPEIAATAQTMAARNSISARSAPSISTLDLSERLAGHFARNRTVRLLQSMVLI